MYNTKTTIIPTFLISILLFTTSNLKIGKFLNNFFTAIFQPISTILSQSRASYQNQIDLLRDIPEVNKQNREQKVLISHLIKENENLKQILKDSKIENDLKGNYQKVIPLKVNRIKNKVIATTSQSTTEIKPGMPIVNGNILLGLVTDISENIISITSLEDDLFPPINLKSSTGPRGVFRHFDNNPQIINVPSQTPIILGDFVLTEASEYLPENLLVGKVSKITTSPQDPLQKGEVTLYDTFASSPNNIVVIVKP